MTNNSQKTFLEFLHKKYNMVITGFNYKDLIQVELNKIKNHKVFLLPYTDKDTINYLNKTKDGEVFTTSINKYFVKNDETGEKKIINVSKSNTLLTKLYNRDLIILDTTNKYNEKLIKELAPYEIVDLPKRINLFYRVDKNTILDDIKGVIK